MNPQSEKACEGSPAPRRTLRTTDEEVQAEANRNVMRIVIALLLWGATVFPLSEWITMRFLDLYRWYAFHVAESRGGWLPSNAVLMCATFVVGFGAFAALTYAEVVVWRMVIRRYDGEAGPRRGRP